MEDPVAAAAGATVAAPFYAIPAGLMNIAERVGMPVLDATFFDGLPAVLERAGATAAGRRLLECMFEVHSRNVVVYSSSATAPDVTVALNTEQLWLRLG